MMEDPNYLTVSGKDSLTSSDVLEDLQNDYEKLQEIDRNKKRKKSKSEVGSLRNSADKQLF